MSIRVFQDKRPQLARGVFIDESAQVIGDVSLGEDSSVWPLAVIRGDVNAIHIGQRTNIQDLSVLHVTHKSEYYPQGFPLIIGNDVTVGHHAVLHGCHIADRCLIGMGAHVLDGAMIEEEVLLGAGSLLGPNKVLKSGYLYVGNPAKQIRPLTDEERNYFHYSAQHYVDLKNQYLSSER